MDNKKAEELIGETILGFSFESNYGNIGYLPSSMDKYVGVEGKITSYYCNIGMHRCDDYQCFHVSFGSEGFSYPADLVYKQFLSEIKSKEEIYGDIDNLLNELESKLYDTR